MKIKSLLPRLESLVAPYNTPENRSRYRSGDFPRADKVKDLTKRFRWDCLYAASIEARQEFSLAVYNMGANDSHIYTGLKSLIASLDESGEEILCAIEDVLI